MSSIEERLTQAVRDRAAAATQEAIAMRQAAIAMRNDAKDTLLRLWQERLTRQMHNGRDTALERALDAAVSVASADYANIQGLHANGHGLMLIAQRGFSPSFLNYFEFVDDGTSACGLALKERRPVVVHDIVSSPIFVHTQGLDVLLDAGIRSVKSTPLIGHAGRILGVISVHYREPRPQVDSELVRFQTLANTVARLIDGTST